MVFQNSKKESINAILQRIFQSRGFEILDYGLPYIQRRIHGRMLALGISELKDYEEYINSNTNEYNPLLNAILGEESKFFRDPKAWEFLEQSILSKILNGRGKNENNEIRIWSVGCASGEEAYSIALILTEFLKDNIHNNKIRIYATDIDESALRVARSGTYMADQLIGLPDPMKEKYLSHHDNLFTISSNIRNLLVFGKHNIVIDPPISNIDLLLCRNVLLYLEPALRIKVMQNLRYALNENGYLWLGKGERHIDHIKYGFRPLGTKWRFFKRLPNREYYQLSPKEDENRELESDKKTFGKNVWQKTREFGTGLILLDENHQVILYDRIARELCLQQYFARSNTNNSNTTDYRLHSYHLMKTVPPISFFDLDIGDNIANLQDKIKQAENNGEFLLIDGMEQWVNSEKLVYIRMTIIPLAILNLDKQGFLIHLEDITSFYELNKKFHLTVKSLETANEKLHSANMVFQKAIDELEIINEYLQSRNNEELILLNEKLIKRTAELEELRSQYHAILDSVNFGVIIIDPNLFVSALNYNAANMIKIDQDIIEGRSLVDFYDNKLLANIAKRVLDVTKKGISTDYVIREPDAENKEQLIDISIDPINGERNKGVVLTIRERRNHDVDI